MLRIVMDVDSPVGQAIGIKEALAMDLERYGDVRVVSVEEITPWKQEVIDNGWAQTLPVLRMRHGNRNCNDQLYRNRFARWGSAAQVWMHDGRNGDAEKQRRGQSG